MATFLRCAVLCTAGLMLGVLLAGLAWLLISKVL